MPVIQIPLTTSPSNAQFGEPNLILHEPGWDQFYAVSSGSWLSIKSFYGGDAYYQVGRNRFVVNENRYLILNHAQPYTIEIDSHHKLDSFCLFFSPGFVESIHRDLRLADDILLDDPGNTTVSKLHFIEKTYFCEPLLTPVLLQLRHMVSSAELDRSALNEYLHEIVQRFLQVHYGVYREIENLPLTRSATREEIYRRLSLVIDYVEASLSLPVTLADMAHVAGFSPTHLLRTFRQVFHQTPHQYILSRRLKVARHLLRTTSANITDISLQVGFESPTAFSTKFRRLYGMSPREYRLQIQKGDFEEV